jgi:hypothetical protein
LRFTDQAVQAAEPVFHAQVDGSGSEVIQAQRSPEPLLQAGQAGKVVGRKAGLLLPNLIMDHVQLALRQVAVHAAIQGQGLLPRPAVLSEIGAVRGAEHDHAPMQVNRAGSLVCPRHNQILRALDRELVAPAAAVVAMHAGEKIRG